MSSPYRCPACGTNKSRFNVIEQVVQEVKKHPETGDITQLIAETDPLHIHYQGEQYRVQCGVCGVIDSEERFILFAQQDQY